MCKKAKFATEKILRRTIQMYTQQPYHSCMVDFFLLPFVALFWFAFCPFISLSLSLSLHSLLTYFFPPICTIENYYHNVHNRRPSGTGILELSPAKAGQDVTPANYTFAKKANRKKSDTSHSGLAGEN